MLFFPPLIRYGNAIYMFHPHQYHKSAAIMSWYALIQLIQICFLIIKSYTVKLKRTVLGLMMWTTVPLVLAKMDKCISLINKATLQTCLAWWSMRFVWPLSFHWEVFVYLKWHIFKVPVPALFHEHNEAKQWSELPDTPETQF